MSVALIGGKAEPQGLAIRLTKEGEALSPLGVTRFISTDLNVSATFQLPDVHHLGCANAPFAQKELQKELQKEVRALIGAAMPRPYHILDVFTDKALQGNPLAVVLEAEGLGDGEMQAIAREFNLAETVFVFSPDDPTNSAKIRIFTPMKELPFAGHPTVGTAALLADVRARSHLGGSGIVIALEEKIGLVKVDVSKRSERGLRGVFPLPVLPQLLDSQLDVSHVAAALGVDPLEIGFGAHGLSAWSAGVPFIMVPLRSLEAMKRVKIGDSKAWDAAFGGSPSQAVYLYTRETQDPACHIHARMFAPKLGITEDPATGSAAAAFAGVAATCELPEDGIHQIIIEQGYEMGRPSLIALDLDIQNGRLAAAHIGGSAVRIAEGTLFL